MCVKAQDQSPPQWRFSPLYRVHWNAGSIFAFQILTGGAATSAWHPVGSGPHTCRCYDLRVTSTAPVTPCFLLSSMVFFLTLHDFPILSSSSPVVPDSSDRPDSHVPYSSQTRSSTYSMNQDLNIVRENILEETPALTQNLLNLVLHNIPMKPVTQTPT